MYYCIYSVHTNKTYLLQLLPDDEDGGASLSISSVAVNCPLCCLPNPGST